MAPWVSVGEESSARPIVLLVEDNPGDVRLTQLAFEEAHVENDLHVVRNGTDALDFLQQRGAYEGVDRPDIVLLDLNLPGLSGFDVLDAIKTDPDLLTIPLIVLTSSDAEEDVIKSYEEYANAYLSKPTAPDEFIDLAQRTVEFWTRWVRLPSMEE